MDYGYRLVVRFPAVVAETDCRNHSFAAHMGYFRFQEQSAGAGPEVAVVSSFAVAAGMEMDQSRFAGVEIRSRNPFAGAENQ